MLVPNRVDSLHDRVRLDNAVAVEREDTVRVRLATTIRSMQVLRIDERDTEDTHVVNRLASLQFEVDRDELGGNDNRCDIVTQIVLKSERRLASLE